MLLLIHSFFRAYRIHKVFEYYERHLENLLKNDATPIESDRAQRLNMKRLNQLKELYLIRYTLYLIIPFFILGLIGFFIKPIVSVFIPVYETKQCWEYYSTRTHYERIECNEWAMVTNQIVFVVYNWIELIILIYMLYKIRNIKDELNIQSELTLIIIMWVFFSTVYFVTQQVQLSRLNVHNDQLEMLTKWIIFTAIELRNLSNTFISFCFCWRNVRRPDLKRYTQQ